MYQTENARVSNPLSISVQDDLLATRPILAAQAEQALSEEELYESFDQAISARLRRLYSPLPLSLPHTTEHEQWICPIEVACSSASVMQERGSKKWVSFLKKASRHNIILVGLALLLMLIGFDLMGVLMLVLRMH